MSCLWKCNRCTARLQLASRQRLAKVFCLSGTKLPVVMRGPSPSQHIDRSVECLEPALLTSRSGPGPLSALLYNRVSTLGPVLGSARCSGKVASVEWVVSLTRPAVRVLLDLLL